MKKLLISFLLGLTVFFSFAPYLSPAKAQTWYNQSFQEWYGKVYDPSNPSEIFGERYTAAQVQWIVYGVVGFFINFMAGPQNAGLTQCLISNVVNVDTCMGQVFTRITANNSLNQTIATVNILPKQNLWSLVFASDRPISGISYVKERLEKLNPVSIVQAQTPGVGFNALQPIQEFWKAFRNVSFGLFVIAAVVFAFMIMFRVKLSPQTVVSVQSALPKIIVSLILVTFSYAIAGFLIDLMYVVIGIVSVIGSPLIKVPAPNVFNFLTLGQPFGSGIQVGALGLLALYLVLFFAGFMVLLLINTGVVITGLMTIITVAVSVFVPPIGIILIVLVVIFAIVAAIVGIWICFKIIWGLLKAFVNILLLTIMAPIQLALGTVIPNLGFGSWIKSYFSNLGVFVVTGGLILFSYIFLAQGVQIGFASWGVTPGSISIGDHLANILVGGGLTQAVNVSGVSAWPPLLGMGGEAGVGLLFVIASFVIFTMIPKANELIQAFLSGKPFAYGSGIGEAFGPIQAAWGKTEAYRKYAGDQFASRQYEKIQTEINKGGILSRALPGSAKDWVRERATQAGKGDFNRKY